MEMQPPKSSARHMNCYLALRSSRREMSVWWEYPLAGKHGYPKNFPSCCSAFFFNLKKCFDAHHLEEWHAIFIQTHGPFTIPYNFVRTVKIAIQNRWRT